METRATPQTPQTPQTVSSEARAHERDSAKKRVLAVFLAGGDWKSAAASNAVSLSTARRITNKGSTESKQRGGVRPSSVKMTVEVMAKLEEYLDEMAGMTMAVMKERLMSDLAVDVSISSIHRALHGMLYSIKKLRVEKASMNNSENKEKRKKFATSLNKHIADGDMIVYHDETNFNIYLTRTQGWSRVGDPTVVILPPSKGENLHVQCGVSPGTGTVLLRTYDGSVKMDENARFVADLFVSALNTDEYKDLCAGKNVVAVTDNAPANNQVETRVRDMLVADGIPNGNKLVILRLAPYSPMCKAIEGCFSVLKARMKTFLATMREEFLVRGDYGSLAAHRIEILKEAVEKSKSVLTQRLVWREERHCLKNVFAAERGENMELGK